MELSFKNVSKNYGGIFAVDDITYTMETGVYGLLGVNGAGKTTLMKMLCTVTRPTAGEIRWNGEDIFRLEERYRDLLGYLPQDFGYYPNLSVSDYMMYIASIKGIRPAVARKRMKELLEMVGLSRYKNRKMKALSGGMARRVGIAQAMLNNPKILVLDEPTAGLDPSERIRFRNLISELSEDRLVLLSTHIVSDVEFIAEQILLMKDGKFFYTGTSEDLIASMEEEVWTCVVPRQDVNQYLQKYPVGNVKHVAGGAELRILSENPPAENAVLEEATLEDAFLLYFGEKAGDENVEV
ncbi:MAG: ABC transporter ATP-binding protein [Dorea sp.]|nr:ABC transporter ATP-binding protein [Dorea sp.]